MTLQELEAIRKFNRGILKEAEVARRKKETATRYDRKIRHASRETALRMVVRRLERL